MLRKYTWQSWWCSGMGGVWWWGENGCGTHLGAPWTSMEAPSSLLWSLQEDRVCFVCSFPLEPVFHDLRDRSAGERPSEGVFISEDNYGSWVGVLVWPISRLSPVPWVGSSTQEHVWLSMFRDHCGPFALAADRHFHMQLQLLAIWEPTLRTSKDHSQ